MITAKESDIQRIFSYAWDVYSKKLHYVLAFSIPLIFAGFLLATVQAPTYSALGAPHLRTGSIPDLSIPDIAIIIIVYLGAMLIFAETIVNVNLLIKSKRMLTNPSSEILRGLGKYAFSISAFLIILFLIIFVVQLLTFEKPGQRFIFPLITFLISYFLFFTPTAIVIDDEDVFSAIRNSIRMAMNNPRLIITWVVFAAAVITLLGWLFVEANIIPRPFSTFLYIALHVLFISPFLLILQTQMYMEKYPLAK